MFDQLEPSWRRALAGELSQPYIGDLRRFVDAERQAGPVYPPPGELFAAFALTPFDAVKVVILGQDPYHGPGQAHGLSFSVPPGTKIPPSLRNIAKELAADTGRQLPAGGDLRPWARQGVLLLNATLTVRGGQAGSHQGRGWERLTDAAIARLSAQRQGLVFMLWGNHALAKAGLVDTARHRVLAAAHPSPLSARRGFFGCRHFSQANQYLESRGATPIEWGAKPAGGLFG